MHIKLSQAAGHANSQRYPREASDGIRTDRIPWLVCGYCGQYVYASLGNNVCMHIQLSQAAEDANS
jgi:hypothetical protein